MSLCRKSGLFADVKNTYFAVLYVVITGDRVVFYWAPTLTP